MRVMFGDESPLQSSCDGDAPAHQFVNPTNAGVKGTMNLLVVTREQGRRRLDEVGRIGCQAAGGEAKHAAAGELERGRKPGVDLEVRVGVQRHASIGAGDGGGEMERGFGAVG